MPQEISVLAIPGSLRRDSYNRALILAAKKLAPAGTRLSIFEELGDIPHFNPDVEAQGDPAAVAKLRRLASEADGLLIATPEYNWNMPGALKNAIDWISRGGAAGGPAPLRGMPIGVIGASTSVAGTTRAQMSLRQTFVNTQSLVMPAPQVQIASARNKFNEAGELTDPESVDRLRAFLDAFSAWVSRFREGELAPRA